MFFFFSFRREVLFTRLKPRPSWLEAAPPTCPDVEVHGLRLLPPLDARVLLLEGVDVSAHPLHHHAVDGGLMLRLGSAPSARSSPHRAGAQLGDAPVLGSLI